MDAKVAAVPEASSVPFQAQSLSLSFPFESHGVKDAEGEDKTDEDELKVRANEEKADDNDEADKKEDDFSLSLKERVRKRREAKNGKKKTRKRNDSDDSEISQSFSKKRKVEANPTAEGEHNKREKLLRTPKANGKKGNNSEGGNDTSTSPDQLLPQSSASIDFETPLPTRSLKRLRSSFAPSPYPESPSLFPSQPPEETPPPKRGSKRSKIVPESPFTPFPATQPHGSSSFSPGQYPFSTNKPPRITSPFLESPFKLPHAPVSSPHARNQYSVSPRLLAPSPSALSGPSLSPASSSDFSRSQTPFMPTQAYAETPSPAAAPRSGLYSASPHEILALQLFKDVVDEAEDGEDQEDGNESPSQGEADPPRDVSLSSSPLITPTQRYIDSIEDTSIGKEKDVVTGKRGNEGEKRMKPLEIAVVSKTRKKESSATESTCNLLYSYHSCLNFCSAVFDVFSPSRLEDAKDSKHSGKKRNNSRLRETRDGLRLVWRGSPEKATGDMRGVATEKASPKNDDVHFSFLYCSVLLLIMKRSS